MATKVNNCATSGSSAELQARHELKKLLDATPGAVRIEIDDMNENDVRVAASVGDNATRWAKAKDAEEVVAEWNAANAAPTAK